MSSIKIGKPVDGLVDEISIENGHRHSPSGRCDLFEHSGLIAGFVTIASGHVEPVEEIQA